MTIVDEIASWLRTRPEWQQEAVARILSKGELAEADLIEIAALSKTPAGQAQTKGREFPGLSASSASGSQIRLVSISQIFGIDVLAPRNPLNFGSGKLTVVYGRNGSGKSGYTRILKKMTGKAYAVELRGNVFSPSSGKKGCVVTFEVDGHEISENWDAANPQIAALKGVDIFDTECGQFYLNKENEASYIPGVLSVFDKLVRVCEEVRARHEREKQALISALPLLPVEMASTNAGALYSGLTAAHAKQTAAALFPWAPADLQRLDAVTERLNTSDPAKLAKDKRAQKVQLDLIVNSIAESLDQVSVAACVELRKLEQTASEKRKIAAEGANAIQSAAPLPEIGGATWREMWEAARSYSTQSAYPKREFPVTDDELAACVLCQQPLGDDARSRLQSFEQYVKGSLVASAETADRQFKEVLKKLPAKLSKEAISTAMQAAGLDEATWLERLEQFWADTARTVEALQTPTPAAPEGLLPESFAWIDLLRQRSSTLDAEATQHESDAKLFDRPAALAEQKELLARKWIFDQTLAVNNELDRLTQVSVLDGLMENASTKSISLKAGAVAETVITDAYISRFNTELAALGAGKIKVELKKTRATKGRALHAVALKGLDSKSGSTFGVLSEGEQRMVTLAAFLADVTGRNDHTPFIFDDPISSLDQDFEEKTIDRLLRLTADRQVIVFTHRLSFLGLIEDKSSPEPEVICIRQEPWGSGEPGSVPIFGKRPEGALKNLRNDRLAAARKVLSASGSEAYYPLAKAICSDFRIIVERVVECVFLGDVIQRHRRSVQTMNKIGQLAKITKADCDLIDDLMTRYSCYEHSQSNEAPVDVPEPEQLDRDIESLLVWHDEFKARPVT